MDASLYKDYMLDFMFYKFLSDKTLEIFAGMAGLSKDDDISKMPCDVHVQAYEQGLIPYIPAGRM